MTTYFVTSHPGAREWAEQEGIHIDEVTSSLEFPTVRPGDVVIGALSVAQAAEVCSRGGCYLHLTLQLLPQLQGCALDAQQMRDSGAHLEQYQVRHLGRADAQLTRPIHQVSGSH